MPIVSDADCQEKMDQYQLTIAGSMVCAGGEGKASCNVGLLKNIVYLLYQGDSGGALTVKGTIVGVVSYGAEQCGQVGVQVGYEHKLNRLGCMMFIPKYRSTWAGCRRPSLRMEASPLVDSLWLLCLQTVSLYHL